MPRRFELVENPLRGFPPVFAVCCAHIVDTPDTMFHFPQAGNSTCLRVSPLPIKRVSALWGPLSASRQIPHLQPEKCFCPRTRRGQKRFGHCSPHLRRTLRGFFDSLAYRRGYMLRRFPYLCLFHECRFLR